MGKGRGIVHYNTTVPKYHSTYHPQHRLLRSVSGAQPRIVVGAFLEGTPIVLLTPPPTPAPHTSFDCPRLLPSFLHSYYYYYCYVRYQGDLDISDMLREADKVVAMELAQRGDNDVTDYLKESREV